MNKKYSTGPEDFDTENIFAEYPLCDIVREMFKRYPAGFPTVTGFPYKSAETPHDNSESCK